MNKGKALFFCAITIFLISSCQQSNNSNLVPVQLDRPRAERLLNFYFGSYTASKGISPTEAGLLHIEGEDIFVSQQSLDQLGLSAQLEDINGDQVINWDELEPFLLSTYYEARKFPSTLETLYAQTGTPHPDSGWMDIELDGMMVSARRQIFVQEEDVQQALLAYRENKNQLLYPTGTIFIGHHYNKGELVETTISQKRNDQFWDFFIYDQEGRLTPNTVTGPKELLAPTRCVGCHVGTKLFEPEVSFPNGAPDGPFGQRGIYVEEEARNSEIATHLDEHAKRSDTVLGLYATVYASRLQSKLDAGEILTERERTMLEAIDLSQ